MILYNFKNLLPKNENITEYHAMLRVRTSIKKEFLLRVMSNIYNVCIIHYGMIDMKIW